MTKKAVLLALVAALAYCSPASANVLSLGTAKSLAKRLAAKQVRTRQIVSIHVLRGHRVNAREIKFAYDDRSAQNVFCTSVIIVKLRTPTSNVARATFDPRASVCHGMPAAALAYEAATRTAVRAVGAEAGVVASSIKTLQQSSLPCRRLSIPRNRRAQVALFSASARSSAIYDPIDAQLQAFVNSIGGTRTSDGVLLAGAAGWADLLEVYRSLPAFQPSLCGAVKRWAAAGWAASAAPADYAVLKVLDARAARDRQAIARASTHLANLGVFPRTAFAFTPDGLILLGVGA
jgi:hypothetical protein